MSSNKPLPEINVAELCREAEKELQQARKNFQEGWELVSEARKELYQPKDIYNQ